MPTKGDVLCCVIPNIPQICSQAMFNHKKILLYPKFEIELNHRYTQDQPIYAGCFITVLIMPNAVFKIANLNKS